jgi:hypothetical protein
MGRPPLRAVVAKVTDSLAMAKEMFPGKRNSLDALCDRLEVDNSGRTLHGALLDAELLADVYINMTRGQEALLIDAAPATRRQASRRASTCASSRCPCCWPATRRPRRTRRCWRSWTRPAAARRSGASGRRRAGKRLWHNRGLSCSEPWARRTGD